MTRQPHLRASDADREQVAERLRGAATEGRLLADELDDRLGAALSARTYGELDALVSDLPATSIGPRRRSTGPVRVPLVVTLLAALVLTATVAFGGHPHTEHHWGGGGGSGLLWLVWIAVAWGLFAHRRTRGRRNQ